MSTTNRSDTPRTSFTRSCRWCAQRALRGSAFEQSRGAGGAAVRLAGRSGQSAHRHGQGRAGRCSRRHFRAGGQGVDRILRPGDRPHEPPGVHRRGRASSGISRMHDARSKDARHWQRRVAVPVPLVKEANGWRFDTAAGKEEVIARRIGRNELAAIEYGPCVCHRATALRRAGTRRQAGRRARDEVRERSGQGERPVLARCPRSEAKSARGSGGAGSGRRAPGRWGPHAALAVSWLLFQDPYRAGILPLQAEPEAMSSRATCLEGSRLWPGRLNTT